MQLYPSRAIEFLLLPVVSATLWVLINGQNPLYVTGDEPRYLYHAFSFWMTGEFKSPQELWQPYAVQQGIAVPFVDLFQSVHAPTHVPFFSYAAAAYGVESARQMQSLIWLIAFFGCYYLARTLVWWPYALCAAVLTAVLLPFFSYGRLLFSEIWLAAILSWALALGVKGKNPFFYFVSIALSLSLPFFHLRMAFISPVLLISIVFLKYPIREMSLKSALKVLLLPLSMTVVFGSAFVAYQFSLNGSVGGSANAPYQPSILQFPTRLGHQLFSSDHGLLTYTPILLLSFCGLLLLASKRGRISLVLFAVLTVYIASFVWGEASESPPARFWTAMMPVFCVGLAHWFANLRRASLWVATMVLGYPSLLNSFHYYSEPNDFLNNRVVSLTYDGLYGHGLGSIYLPKFLPTGTFFPSQIGLPTNDISNFHSIVWLSLLSSTLVLLMLFASRAGGVKRIADVGIVTVCCCSILGSLCEQIQTRISGGGDKLVLEFDKDAIPVSLRFPDASPLWLPDFPKSFAVQYLSHSGEMLDAGIIIGQKITLLPVMPRTSKVEIVALDGNVSELKKNTQVLARPDWWP